MHYARLVICALPAWELTAIEAGVLEAAGEFYTYPVSRFSRAAGYAPGHALEFVCTSPATATAIAASAMESGAGTVELTIDGRVFPVAPAALESN